MMKRITCGCLQEVMNTDALIWAMQGDSHSSFHNCSSALNSLMGPSFASDQLFARIFFEMKALVNPKTFVLYSDVVLKP